MKKSLLLFISILVLGCQETSIEKKGPIEGVWEREGNIRYENGQPIDTSKFGNEKNQARMFKMYTKKHMMWMNNGINLDTIENKDLYPGAAAFATNYSVENGKLMEYLIIGTDNVQNWLNSELKEGQEGFSFTASINVDENYFSQGNLDSLGNGFFELWKRIE